MATKTTEVISPEESEPMHGGFAPYPASSGSMPATMARGAPPRMVSAGSFEMEQTTARRVEVERDEAKILAKLKVMASAAGDDWYYSFPVKNKRKGTTETIEGPSIKCANAVARVYGNCAVGARVVDCGDHWMIEARFIDYQTGFALMRPFQQRKSQQAIGGKDDGRALDMLLSLGVSKAERNVICNALETFTTFAKEEARNNLVERVGKQLAAYKERVKQGLEKLGVDLKRVEAGQGRAYADWLAADVAKIIAQMKAVSDGMATVREIWPPAAEPEPQRNAATTADQAKGEQPEGEQPSADDQGSAAGPNWRPEGTGQEQIVKKIVELFSLAKTDDDVDAILAQNADRMGKYTGQNVSTIRSAARDRKLQIEQEAKSGE